MCVHSSIVIVKSITLISFRTDENRKPSNAIIDVLRNANNN